MNKKTYNGGIDVNGHTATTSILNDGKNFYDMTRDNASRDAMLNNLTQYQNSILKKSGSDSVGEAQALAVNGAVKLSAGFELFGSGGTVGLDTNINANLNHKSENGSIADLNRAMNEAIFSSLEKDKENGVFNDKNGNFSEDLYNQAARERFGAYNESLKEAVNGTYGPGNTGEKLLDTTENIGKSLQNEAGGNIDKIKIDKNLK